MQIEQLCQAPCASQLPAGMPQAYCTANHLRMLRKYASLGRLQLAIAIREDTQYAPYFAASSQPDMLVLACELVNHATEKQSLTVSTH